MNRVPKYYNVCNESIYIVLRCSIEDTYTSIIDLHPCLTKESEFETRKHVVKVGYVEVHNVIETLSKNIFWISPRITDQGLKFLDDYSHFAHIYEYGNNFRSEP